MKTVSASEANRQFSSVLREVSHGEVFTVLSRGKPIATIAPANSADNQRQAAKRSLLGRLRKQQPTGVRSWTRNDLYDC